MDLFTIGFTKISAKRFFSLLKASGTKRVVDVRLNNSSQLAGFAKQDDLKFFLREICGIEYVHLPDLAPTKPMLDSYRKDHKDWARYQSEFLRLMDARRIENSVPKELLADGCLLCSEDTPHHCHRRLVAEYLKTRWGGVNIHHLTAKKP